MPFLKNRELRIKVANTKKENDNPNAKTDEFINPEVLKNIEETTKRIVKTIGVTVGVAVLAFKAVDILGEIAVKKTRSGDTPKN